MKKHKEIPKVETTEHVWKWWKRGLIFAVIVAAIVRIPFFGTIPAGLDRDEAALGYNAYSLMKAGIDEYGKKLPISITSFGDEKLPGYVYTLIPFIAMFGLNIWSVRLPSMIAGFFVLIGMGVLTRQLGRNVRLSRRATTVFSFLTMIFLAVAPWAHHFSNVAFEAHLAMAFFIWGFVAYNAAMVSEKQRSQRVSLILTAVLWGLTPLTYHSYHIFLPLFVCGLFFIDFQRIRKFDSLALGVSSVIGVCVVAMLFFGGVFRADFVKNIGISPFSKKALESTATAFRSIAPGENALYERILFNRYAEGLVVFYQNYVSVFGSKFLFVTGSGHGDNDPGGINNFDLYIPPLLLLGIICLCMRRKNADVQRILLWSMVAVVPAALTIEPQHEIRLSPWFPVLELIAGFGATMVLIKLRERRWQRLFIVGLSVLIVLSSLRTFIIYNFLVPERVVSNEHYHLLAKTLMKYQPLGLPVVTQSPSSSPYIWYLFESKYDPVKLQSVIERYPMDQEGFIHVKRIDNIYFETIKWDDIFAWSNKQSIILVFQPKEVPVEMMHDSRLIPLENITDSKGQIVYEVFKTGGQPGPQ